MSDIVSGKSQTDPDEICEHTLAWHSLHYTVGGKRTSRVIIDSMSGKAMPGRLLGILGPSGSGKVGRLYI